MKPVPLAEIPAPGGSVAERRRCRVRHAEGAGERRRVPDLSV